MIPKDTPCWLAASPGHPSLVGTVVVVERLAWVAIRGRPGERRYVVSITLQGGGRANLGFVREEWLTPLIPVSTQPTTGTSP